MSKNGRKNQAPAFQFYPQDFWSSRRVAAMTAAEVGLYLRLLSDCFLDEGLPTDLKDLSMSGRAIGMTNDEFMTAWSRTMSSCFVEHEGRLWSPRMLREREHLRAYEDAKSRAGRAGAGARWQKDGTRMRLPSEQNGKRMANDSPQPIPTHPNPELKGALDAPKVERPRLNGKSELEGALSEFPALAGPGGQRVREAAERYRARRVERRWPIWDQATWKKWVGKAVFDGQLDLEALRVALDIATDAPNRSVHPKRTAAPRAGSGSYLEAGLGLIDLGGRNAH